MNKATEDVLFNSLIYIKEDVLHVMKHIKDGSAQENYNTLMGIHDYLNLVLEKLNESTEQQE